MPGDSFYSTAFWINLRRAVLERDRYTCVVPGCGTKAVSVDHIRSRRTGGSNSMTNLRSLCKLHDNQIKENRSGDRNRGGSLTIPGCDASGRPLDPQHPWRKE